MMLYGTVLERLKAVATLGTHTHEAVLAALWRGGERTI